MTTPIVSCTSGCSSGLGLALVTTLAGRGGVHYAGLRNLADATRLPPGVIPLRLDVTRAEDVAAAVSHIESEHGRLDLLVNNAGIQAVGPWELVPVEVIRRVVEVNYLGAVQLTTRALPLLRRTGGGTIVFVSSLSGLVALPADGVYAASKFALEAFAESLAAEVRRFQIRVLVVNPGGYATELAGTAWRPDVTQAGPYRSLVEALAPKGGGTPAAAAAAELLRILDQPDPSFHNAIDPTGRAVFRALAIGQDEARKAIARHASGLGWWMDGEPAPPSS